MVNCFKAIYNLKSCINLILLNMRNVFFYSILVLVLTTSCVNEPVYVPIDETPIEESSCDPNLEYFVNDVLPIIQANCNTTGCHGNGSAADGVDLTTYAGIMEEVNANNATNSKLYKVMVDTDNEDVMPPSPNNRLSTDQILIIKNWINQGAQNNECTDCNTTSVTYSQTILPIINASCKGCHSGTSPDGGISYTNYTEIKESALSGSLMGVVNHANGYVAMPYNQTKLSDCKIEQLTIWVNAGAPNN